MSAPRRSSRIAAGHATHKNPRQHSSSASRAKPRAPKRKPAARSPSPDWDVHSDDFATTPERGSPPYRPSPTPSHSPALPSDDEGEPEEDQPDAEASSEDIQGDTSTAATNARSPNWLAWQDRALVRCVDVVRPFEAERGPATQAAWQAVAAELLAATKRGKTPVDRTDEACRARFRLLLKAHRKEQTRAKQKTGTNEEINEHVKLLTQIDALVDGHTSTKTQKSAAARKKAELEKAGALEIRDAAMKGMVRREELTDIANVEGATLRERQGQRKRRRAELGNTSDDENNADSPSKHKRRRENKLTTIIRTKVTEDNKRLREAREADEQRHQQLLDYQERSLAMQNRFAEGMASLAEAQAQILTMQRDQLERDERRRQEDAERARADAEHRAAEASRNNALLLALAGKK